MYVVFSANHNADSPTEFVVWSWNINIHEGKSLAICFSRRLRIPDYVLQLNERDIPFVNTLTYLGVTFDRRRT
jgi:hypothetical protein